MLKYIYNILWGRSCPASAIALTNRAKKRKFIINKRMGEFCPGSAACVSFAAYRRSVFWESFDQPSQGYGLAGRISKINRMKR